MVLLHRNMRHRIVIAPKEAAMAIRSLRSLAYEDLSVGLSELVMKTVTDQDVVGFADISGDQNPIHLCDLYASKTRFGQRIAHGLYTASLISAVIGTRCQVRVPSICRRR